MTLFEVVVVVVVVMLLAVVFLPALLSANREPQRASCAGGVKQICLTYLVWSGDNGGKYPMGISVTNGGSMGMVATGDVVRTFLVMSNELSDPRLLHCMWDKAHTATATRSFAGLASSNISYFVGVDVTNDSNPQAFLAGDDNFEIGGVAVKSGLLELSPNTSIAWTSARHTTHKRHFWDDTTSFGNVGLADGSVQQTTISSRTNFVQRSSGTITTSFTSLLQATGLATNRLAIP